MIEAFLLGAIATASAVASLFFLRFWRSSRDTLFLAFSAFFALEALGRVAMAFAARPNEGSPWIYVVRLIALLLVLAAIVKKNFGKG